MTNQIQTLMRAAYKILIGYAPLKGPLTMALTMDFAVTPSPINIDLVNDVTQDKFEYVQSVYVDNSANPNSFSITFGTTGQKLTWPAFSQGYLPCAMADVPKFVCTTTGTVAVNINLFNIPLPACIWNTGVTGTSGGQPVVMAGSTGTDNSANKPALLGNLLSTAAVNANRANIEVQNQSLNVIQVVLDDGAGANISIILLQGVGAGQPGGEWSDQTFKGRVRVFAAAAGDQIMMRQT